MHDIWKQTSGGSRVYKSVAIRAIKCIMVKPSTTIIFMAVVLFIPGLSHEHSILNTPPILVVPERNWRISESETVGQIIARIRADDSENDELMFGLESQYKGSKVPFRIDPIGGVVYLNESLIGRGGENFFLYITVTDGQLTAKNEVFVNILPTKDAKHKVSRPPPSISNVIYNISHFLPSFDRLPGVQSIRNQEPNRRPSNIFPPGFGNTYPPELNYNSNKQMPSWPSNNNAKSSEDTDNDYSIELEDKQFTGEITETNTITNTTRTKLTPIKLPDGDTILSETIATTSNNGKKVEKIAPSGSKIISNDFSSQIIPLVLIGCAVFTVAAVVGGFMYRKRLCAVGKNLKKKSKEEMEKKSNQSNLSSINLTVDSRNSMVLQHWNGPMAYGNRYVPWERDQQQQQQLHQMSQQSIATTSNTMNTANGAAANSFNSQIGVVGGPTVGSVSGPHTSGGSTQIEKIDKWEFPRHRLKFFNILGEGAFGQVWRCEATDLEGEEGVTTVAVKTLKENASEAEKKDLLSELEVMKSLEPHVNVVRFLGCCTDKDPIFVIMEYVNRGKLQTHLRNSRAERHYGNTHGKSNVLTSGDLTSFMYQVARGMDYLTSRGIIHRDLAARNVLITEDCTCKVADFGFARDVITSKIYERKSEGKLPIRWMAIESLYDNIFSVKSDIWSFGVLMWEIVTLGSTPYPGISASDVMRKVRDGYRLEKPEHCRRELYNIMYYCWSQDPNERPSFTELVHMLDKLLHTEMDYIELERFPDHNYYNIINPSGEKV